ncbi:MAG: MFS transporter [Burkholderiaceae bacterium]|nr:MFS transporter [Burkholderiaceae bacterium]
MSTATLQTSLRREAETIGWISLAHGTSHFFHLLLPPLFPTLMSQLGLTFTQCGLLMSVFFIVSGVGQALAGFVVDRAGPLPVLLSGIGALACAGMLLGWSTSYDQLLVVAAIAGAGNSIFHPADFTILNRNVTGSRPGDFVCAEGCAVRAAAARRGCHKTRTPRGRRRLALRL